MAKEKVAVVVDSTAYIVPELLEKYNIHVIPQILNWEGKSYHDDVDIKPEEFYQRLPQSKAMPTTSQPSAGEFHELFSQLAETADSIVAVLISEPLSGTQASARAAADMMDDFPIEIVDSRSTSMGLGFMALEAARAVERGASYKEAAEAARLLVPHMHVAFVVDTLEFLHRGGRIGGAKRLVGSVLSIKPVLHLADGRIEPLASVRTKRKAVQHLVQIVADELNGKENTHVAIIHAAADEEAQALYDQVKSSINPSELLLTGMSPVIGTHAGPGTVGLVYYTHPG
jgi:DegV family protein with EDD domain